MGGCTFSCWYLHWKCYFMCLIDCILFVKTMTTAFRVSKLDCSMKTLFWIIKIIQALLFSAFIKMWNCTSNQLWLIFQLMCARIEISILLLQCINIKRTKHINDKIFIRTSMIKMECGMLCNDALLNRRIYTEILPEHRSSKDQKYEKLK